MGVKMYPLERIELSYVYSIVIHINSFIFIIRIEYCESKKLSYNNNNYIEYFFIKF